ncbi:hypothetical protein YC2023_067085 [Brassica napus]
MRSFSHSREPFGIAQGENFSGIYRKVQMKPLKWDGESEEERPVEALMILKYGELFKVPTNKVPLRIFSKPKSKKEVSCLSYIAHLVEI